MHAGDATPGPGYQLGTDTSRTSRRAAGGEPKAENAETELDSSSDLDSEDFSAAQDFLEVFTAWAALPREERQNATVYKESLRAKAAHVSTEPALGLGGADVTRKDGKPVTSGDINAMFESADAKTAI